MKLMAKAAYRRTWRGNFTMAEGSLLAVKSTAGDAVELLFNTDELPSMAGNYRCALTLTAEDMALIARKAPREWRIAALEAELAALRAGE